MMTPGDQAVFTKTDCAMNGLRQSVSHIGVFAALDDDELMDIIRTCSMVHYPPGKIVCDAGDPPGALFLIDKGMVRLLHVLPDGSTEVVSTLETGDAIGALSFLEGKPRSCRAVAVSPCTLYRVDREQFNTLRANLRPSAFKFIRVLSSMLTARLRDINERMRVLQEDPEGSIAYLRRRAARLRRQEAR